MDDAWIHLRYAQVLAEGEPYRYVSGEPVSTGATSLLWPVILAPFAWLGARGAALWGAAVALAAMWNGLAMFHTWRWVRCVSGDGAAALAALALALTGPWMWGVASGMEVALVGAALAGTLDTAVVSSRPVQGRVWIAVLACARPEGAALAGLVALVQAGRELRAGRGGTVSALAWLLAAAPGAIQPLLHQALRGAWMGSSVVSKQLRWPPLQGADRWRFAWQGVVGEGYAGPLSGGLGWGAVALVTGGLVWLAFGAPRRPALAGVALAGLALPVVGVSAVTSVLIHHARYLQPAAVLFAPLGVLACLAGLARMRVPTRMALGVAALALLAPRVALLPEWARTYARDARAMAWHDGWAAEEVAARAGPGDSVAVNDAGALAVFSGRRIVDLEGIVTERALPWAAEGEGTALAFLRKERPAWAAVFPAWFPALAQAGVFRVEAAHEVPPGSISGAAVKVVARLDLSKADAAEGLPRLAPGERVLDSLDLCDLDDEAAHGFTWRGRTPHRGTTVRLGLDAGGAEVLDGVRALVGPAAFRLRDPQPTAPSRLVLRVAGKGGRLRVGFDGGGPEVQLPDARERGLEEVSIPLEKPADSFVLEPLEGTPLIARAWLVR